MSMDPDDDTVFGDRAFADAITLCNLVTNAKTIRAQLQRLRKLQRDLAAVEGKVIAVQDQATQTNAALDQRQAAIDERECAIIAREDEFTASVKEAHDTLHQYYSRLAAAERQLIHRVMSTTGLLGNWNPDLQPLPTWQQLRRMIADLPDDLPAPTAEVVSQEVAEDWTGNVFVPGSTLTRSTEHKRKSAA